MRKFGKRSEHNEDQRWDELGYWVLEHMILQDLYNCGVLSCASSPGKLGQYKPSPTLKRLGTKAASTSLEDNRENVSSMGWTKIRRKSEQSRRTLKSSWVRKSVSEANERVLEVECLRTLSGREKPDEYGNECSGKEKWPARFTFAVVNKGRNETDSVLTESAVAPEERCPLWWGKQTEQVFVSWLAA